MPPTPQSDVLRGSVELLVLETLSLEPMHGWGLGQRIQQITGGALAVNQGSLNPPLQRLEKSGAITSEWQTAENNRRARVYAITPWGGARWARKRRDGAASPRRGGPRASGRASRAAARSRSRATNALRRIAGEVLARRIRLS